MADASIRFRSLPLVARLATMLAYFMAWVLFAELIIGGRETGRRAVAGYSSQLVPIFTVIRRCQRCHTLIDAVVPEVHVLAREPMNARAE